MRLKRLDLTRFGKFTDRSIDFGERAPGACDLHILYGPNEAGKSTMLAAFLDLLFSIERQSRFDFIHPYSTMRIGAVLELADGTHEVARVKRPQNSLLDGSGQPISEGIILGELGGIGRDAYRDMFSLDDETLEAGGESILASKGDLGQLLFSASAGLADLSRRLVDIRAEADGFYKVRGRSGELSELKARLATLKEERERLDTLASHYAQLIETRDRTAAQYNEAIGARAKIQARTDEIQRLLNALPRLAAWRGIRDQLTPLAGLPDAPPGWAAALPDLQKEEIELATRAQGIVDEIADLTSQRDALVVDGGAIALAGRVDRLGGSFHPRYMTAEEDLPGRRLQLRDCELQIAGILNRIERRGEPDPARLVLGVSVVGTLRGLIETRSGIEETVRSAGDELIAARHRLEDAQAMLAERAGGRHDAPGNDTRMMSLAATVTALRTDDHAVRRRHAIRSRTKHLAELAERLRDLQPWQGDIDDLAAMAVPSIAEIERWTSQAATMQKRIDLHDAEVERLTTEAMRLNAELEAIVGVAGVVGDREAGEVRTAREHAWAEHRRTLDAASADAFEAALRHDDVVTSTRFGRIAELATLNQTSQTFAGVQADLGRAQQLRDTSQAALHNLQREIVGVMRRMAADWPEMMSLPALDAWLGRRTKALEAHAAVRADERDLLEAETDAGSARDKLRGALGGAGLSHAHDADVDALLALAQSAIDDGVQIGALRDAVDERRRELKRRERALETVVAADQAWTVSWAAACAACWLGDGGVTPSLTTVRESLDALSQLSPALETRASLADRIAKMEHDQTMFAAEAAALAAALNLTGSGPVLDLAQAVSDRVAAAKAVQADRAAKQLGLDAAQARQRALAERLAVHARHTAEMMAHFGVDSLGEVAVQLRLIERKADLDRHAADAARDILDALRVATMDDAEHALDAADRDALDAELAELQARFLDYDQRSRDLFSAHSKALDQVDAVGGDDAVARIEEQRRTVLLEIEDKAARYLRLRLGTAAVEQALRSYRDRHRSSMMARASAAFETMSRGAYTGLTTQPGKDGELLIAVSADGSSKVAAELSKGTRFQLYLALRVAGYHEFVRARRPVPFIADDIMETFDDFRAEETFRLFADMSGVGQVIYLTHHQHLCDIARRVCPDVQVHSL
jgi:uncharacterized protein YhaN